jgi:hypothetical protein
MAFPPGFPIKCGTNGYASTQRREGGAASELQVEAGFEGDSQVELHVETQILGRIDGELTEELSVVSEDSDVEVVGE